MSRTNPLTSIAAGLLLLVVGCGDSPERTAELVHHPLDSVEGVIARSEVAIDPDITSDGGGSLVVSTDDSVTVRLLETGDLDVEDARLVYRAKLRCADLEGRAYLEMLCRFPGRGEFFSRALHAPLSGTQEWTSQETPFLLQPGENPDNVSLNLVVTGPGKVWVDDVRLLKAPRS